MRLEKLSIQGFKSFADKTHFEFEPGLTAFVGPNGCGKSNVVDAVRWVLGEQRPTKLRGAQMLDVIFSGANGRKSLGFAEVTLTLNNESKLLPVPQDIVTVTRRLYRSGESEYFLNKQACRLRDIRQLFMDTGIGMDAYSVVEQGKIDLMLQANMQDRRVIFEEAAGISKYKAHRHAAELKLQHVEQNLLRLGDIIDEVERQWRSIKRQASAARRYKQYADEMNDKRRILSLHKYHQLCLDLEQLAGRIQTTDDERRGVENRIQKHLAARSELEADVIRLNQEIARTGAADVEVAGRLRAAEEAIALNRLRIQELQASEASLRDENENRRRRLTQAEEEIQSSHQELQTLAQRIQTNERDLESLRGHSLEVSKRLIHLKQEVEEKQTAVMEVLREISGHRNQLAGLEADIKALAGQKERLQLRAQETRRELEQLEARTTTARRRMEELEAESDRCRQELQSRQVEREAKRARLQELTDQIGEAKAQHTSKRSRQELLEDLERRFEGFSQGARAILEARSDQQDTAPRGIRGSVADLLHIDLEYAAAIEAAMGEEGVQYIVVDQVRQALEAIDLLRREKLGRAWFLPLDRLEPEATELTLNHPGIIGRAIDLVRFEPEFRPVFEYLLRHVIVIREPGAAHEILAANGNGARLVTLDGDIFEAHGVVSGGSERRRGGMLSRKAELRQLGGEITELESTIRDLEQAKAGLSDEAEQLDEEIEALKSRLHAAAIEMAERNHEIAGFQDQVESRREELSVGESELADNAAELDACSRKRQSLVTEVQLREQDEAELKNDLQRLGLERQGLEEQSAQLETSITGLKVTLAEDVAKRESLQGTIERLKQSLEESRQLIASTERQIETHRQKQAQSEQVIQGKEEEILGIADERKRLQEQLRQQENEREVVREKLEANDQAAAAARTELQAVEQRLQEARLQENETRLRREHLEEQAREQCHVALAEEYASYQDPVDTDWDALAVEMQKLQRRMDGMGSVNLAAIQEQEELQERAQLLNEQRDDLLRAKHRLQEVIRRVNKRCREMFSRTFEDVRQHFSDIFRRLFGGGRADIVLEPDKDVLEAGVDIIAKPPGKSPTTISLLSGGEKVLTAVALMFAIFRARPSPFCILDEVDAALDESNIDRFILILQEFLQRSQFIIITHNKRTMTVADALYGITMEEPGVSKKVSVKLEAAEARVA